MNESHNKMANEDEIFNRLSDVETETQSIKSTIEHHSKLLEDYGSTQRQHSGKLDAIIEAVTRQSARAEANPKTDWLKVVPVLITTIAALVSMFAIILGGLVYLIIVLTSKDAEINRQLINNQAVIMKERREYNELKHRYNDREIQLLRKRVHGLETKNSGLRFNRLTRSDLLIRLSRSGDRW